MLYGLTPLVGTALSRLSVMGHFENVARGVIDLRDVVYFLSTAGLFLAMAVAFWSNNALANKDNPTSALELG